MLQACTNNLALTLCTFKNHVETCCAQDHLQPSSTILNRHTRKCMKMHRHTSPFPKSLSSSASGVNRCTCNAHFRSMPCQAACKSTQVEAKVSKSHIPTPEYEGCSKLLISEWAIFAGNRKTPKNFVDISTTLCLTLMHRS